MLYLIYGSKQYTKAELKKVRQALLKKRPDALSFRFDEESAEEVNINELTSGKGLFEERFLVELDGLFAAGIFDGKEKEVLEKIKASENVFFVLEEKLLKKPLELLKKYAEKTSEEKTATKKEKEFSAFSLGDALGQKNKQRLWILFREAVDRNYAPEEVHGILFWQAKMILLAHKTDSATEAGVSAFPYSKAKQFSKNFTIKESESLLSSFTQALTESREKSIPLEHTLERVILSL